MADIPEILRRWQSARKNQSVWDNYWEDLSRVQLPRRIGFTSQTVPTDRLQDDIYDGTPMQAARGLSNALLGFQWPEGERTFSMRADTDAIDASEEAQAWFDDTEGRMEDAMDNPKARFRQARGEAGLDTVVLGTSVMFVGDETTNLLFQSINLRDATVVWGPDGRAEGMFRRRKFTIRNAITRFEEQNLSKETREKAKTEEGQDATIEIVHAVLPRPNGRVDALVSKDLPQADMWIEVEHKHLIAEGGFHEFPYIVSRWDTASGQDYGISPGMIALPDSNTLQAVGETILVAGQRAADPPIMAPNDGSFSEVNSFPGALSYYDVETAVQVRGNPFFPMETGANIPLTREMQADIRDQVFRAFLRNILNLPIEGPQMTATEVNARKEEFIREIGPVFGRLESDSKAPLVERVFNIMLRAGALAPIPDVLSGENVRFEYESPVKRIRQQVQATSARLWADEMITLGQIDETAIDLINVEAIGRFSAKALDLPHQVVNSREVVAAKGETRAQAQQEAAELATAGQVAEIAQTGAGAIEKTDLLGVKA